MSPFGRGSSEVYGFPQRDVLDSMMPQTVPFAMLSHPGRVRKGNEDSCAARQDLGAFVVCDGMGGAAAGEVASALAVQMFVETLQTQVREALPGSALEMRPQARLNAAVLAANGAVHGQASSSADMQGMGTTLVALLYQAAEGEADSSLTLVHVGDSRCYRLREGVLTAQTLDHSVVEEQVRLGELTPLQAAVHPMRNLITRAVGADPVVNPEIQELQPRPNDVYLLASDGLTRELSEEDLQQLFAAATLAAGTEEVDLTRLAETLVERANDAGGGDNITVLLLRIP